MSGSTIKGRRRAGAAKATLLALFVLIPMLGLLVHLIADQPLAAQLSLSQKVLSALVFAGLPGLIVFASIGARLASQAPSRTVSRAVSTGATKGALVGLGLGLLVAIPTGALPHSLAGWLPLLFASSAAGAVVGAGAGLWIAQSTKQRADSESATS